MKISVFGSGRLGLVQASVLADVGHRVICMDIDTDRVDRLRACDIPFFEPGLEQLVRNGQESGMLSFTTDTKDAIQSSDYLFICVGTPSTPDGAGGLSYVMQVADAIARYMASRNK